jgi:hypothetical protein
MKIEVLNSLLISKEKDIRFLKKIETDKIERFFLEDLSLIDRIKTIETFFNDNKGIYLKLFFWEKDSNLKNYLYTFNIDNFETIVNYKGRTLPGLLVIKFDEYEKVFVRNLLYCHFNHDFSINPYLCVRPQFFIKDDNFQITVLDIYDDRGMFVLESPFDVARRYVEDKNKALPYAKKE